MMAIIWTFGFTEAPNAVGQKLRSHRGEPYGGYAAHGAAGMLTLFIRGVMCNWMDGIDRRCGCHDVDQRFGQGHRHVDADSGVLLHGIRALHREHVPLPSGLMLGGNFTMMDYFMWNEIPTVWSEIWSVVDFRRPTLFSTTIRRARNGPPQGGSV